MENSDIIRRTGKIGFSRAHSPLRHVHGMVEKYNKCSKNPGKIQGTEGAYPKINCVSQTEARMPTISATMPAGTACLVFEMLTAPK